MTRLSHIGPLAQPACHPTQASVCAGFLEFQSINWPYVMGHTAGSGLCRSVCFNGFSLRRPRPVAKSHVTEHLSSRGSEIKSKVLVAMCLPGFLLAQLARP